LLLAAYDTTLETVVDQCAGAIAGIADDLPLEEAVSIAVDAYLNAAGSVPGHVALLREARRLRPIAHDGHAQGSRIEESILQPMIRRFGEPGAKEMPGRVQTLVAVMSTLVDLLQTSEDPALQRFLRDELDAHALFALQRVRAR